MHISKTYRKSLDRKKENDKEIKQTKVLNGFEKNRNDTDKQRNRNKNEEDEVESLPTPKKTSFFMASISDD